MTEKKERILRAALKLFAEEGYASTSTRKVAQTAGVSEGLIFRHFDNKEGLLNSVMEECQEAGREALSDVLTGSDPEEIIRKALELPFSIREDQYEMWRLTYALKWQTDRYDNSFKEPVALVLKNAFDKLGYDDPAAEAELVFLLIDGAATSFLLHEAENKSEILKALKTKYNL